MPTATNKYASSAAGGNSSDIVVDQGLSVTVALEAAAAVALPAGVQCTVLRKTAAGFYQRVPDAGPRSGVPAQVTSEAPEVVFSAPGTYRIVVPATSINVVLTEYR